jgi:hypothetical protein
MSKEMEVKWTEKVEKIVGINIEDVNGSVEMYQHLLVDQILDGYSRTYYVPQKESLA